MTCRFSQAFLLTLLLAFAPAAHALEPPNIIVILADDMGFSDPGCFGGEMRTPALDRLAEEGLRMTRFYNGGMCVVSRATMLTGKWWPRALPEFQETPLLSERLKAAGYRTALIGKWHEKGDPMDRGFDHFFGFLDGFSDHFEGGPSYRLDREPFKDFGPDYYSSDAFTERAVKFVEESSDQPYFLYLSFQAPHNPLQAPRLDILEKRGSYLGGWREARFKRQLKMGLFPAGTTLPDYPENLPDWGSLTPAQRDLEDLRMSVYAAMVEHMDRGIGRLMEAVRKGDKADNTLVLFMSDNGTDSFSVMDGPLLKAGKLPGDRDSNWQPGTGWAYAAVTPWRLYKISQHGGGVTTGAIAWWPGHVGKAGSITASPVNMVDVLPTLMEAAEKPADDSKNAGVSFLPLLRGDDWRRQDPMFFQYMDNRAIRTAEWTLAEVDGSGWQLFHSADDPLETRDLAAVKSETVNQLDRQWTRWWTKESGKKSYQPESTATGPHYKPQGDRGTGKRYIPTAMPPRLADRYPTP